MEKEQHTAKLLNGKVMDKKMNSHLMEHVQKQLFSFNSRMGSSDEGKRPDEFAVWHVARLAE